MAPAGGAIHRLAVLHRVPVPVDVPVRLPGRDLLPVPALPAALPARAGLRDGRVVGAEVELRARLPGGGYAASRRCPRRAVEALLDLGNHGDAGGVPALGVGA